jgi:hypothetical protein
MRGGLLTQGLSFVLLGLGVVLIVETIAIGGGTMGYLFGALFALAGAARLYVARR